MAEKSSGEKKPKKAKSGKKLKSGADRINAWSAKISESVKKVGERCERWSKKADGVSKERLITLAHLFNESHKLLKTITEKSQQLNEAGWQPPKFVVRTAEKFSKGDAVTIKEEFIDFYKLADKNALANMKVGEEMVTGKRVSYFIPQVGMVPRNHLQPVDGA